MVGVSVQLGRGKVKADLYPDTLSPIPCPMDLPPQCSLNYSSEDNDLENHRLLYYCIEISGFNCSPINHLGKHHTSLVRITPVHKLVFFS